MLNILISNTTSQKAYAASPQHLKCCGFPFSLKVRFRYKAVFKNCVISTRIKRYLLLIGALQVCYIFEQYYYRYVAKAKHSTDLCKLIARWHSVYISCTFYLQRWIILVPSEAMKLNSGQCRRELVFNSLQPSYQIKHGWKLGKHYIAALTLALFFPVFIACLVPRLKARSHRLPQEDENINIRSWIYVFIEACVSLLKIISLSMFKTL